MGLLGETARLQARDEIVAARIAVNEIASLLLTSRTMNKEIRHELGRKLNALNAKLNTARMWIEGELE